MKALGGSGRFEENASKNLLPGNVVVGGAATGEVPAGISIVVAMTATQQSTSDTSERALHGIGQHARRRLSICWPRGASTA
jgi:hypothetical protein